MALSAGDPAAGSGMTKAIFDQLDAMLSPPLQQAVDAASGDARTAAQQALDGARAGWRNLAFAVASGVVGHLLANLEVRGVQTTGDVHAVVAGQAANQVGVVLTQSNDGTGRVA
jgi:hypothetical protein